MAGLRLVAELDGDGSRFDNMMRRASRTTTAFGGQFAGLKGAIASAFTIGAITNLSRKTVEFASHLRDVSDAQRVNVEWFQRMANAARLAGGSEDDLMRFLDTANKSREEAFNKPTGEKAQRLGRLGFSPDEIKNLNPQAFFERLVKAFGDGANAQTVLDVEDIGGKSAKNLLAAFSEGFANNSKVLSEDMINQLDAVGDAFTVLQNQLLVQFAPAILEVTKLLMKGASLLQQNASGFSHGHKAAVEGAAEDIKNGVPYMERVANVWRNFVKGFVGGVAGTEVDQQELQAQMEQVEARIQALRKKREDGPPGFQPTDDGKEPKEPRAARNHNMVTDSLVGIGNFLGRNPNLVNAVANQQLNVARQSLMVQQNSLDRLNKIPNGMDTRKRFDFIVGN